MAKKIVTLYIDDTSIRLLVTSGRKVKKWVQVARMTIDVHRE